MLPLHCLLLHLLLTLLIHILLLLLLRLPILLVLLLLLRILLLRIHLPFLICDDEEEQRNMDLEKGTLGVGEVGSEDLNQSSCSFVYFSSCSP